MPAATPTEAAAAPPPSPVAATSPVVAARKSITGGIKTNGSGSNPTTTTIAAQMHTDALKMQQIAKLKILYDQKFSSHCALGRDLKEKQALWASVKKNHDHCTKRDVNIDKTGNSIASLEVEIMMARDLPKMDWYSGKCDPYVILSMSPPAACLDQSDKRTKVKPRERSPVWNQSFIFKPIEFRNADLVLTVMDAENFGNDDFMGKICVPLKGIDTQGWVEKWYQLTDPEKKTEAKQLSGSVLVRTKFIYSEKNRLDGEIKEIKAQKEKLELDMKKIQTHINRLEGKESTRKGSATDDVWLFADFDDDTPLLFTDVEAEGASGQTGGGLVSKHDMCVVL